MHNLSGMSMYVCYVTWRVSIEYEYMLAADKFLIFGRSNLIHNDYFMKNEKSGQHTVYVPEHKLCDKKITKE